MSETLDAPVPLPRGTPTPPVIPTSTVSDPPTFRSHFPEFGDTTAYPDTQVQFYLDISSASLDPNQWGTLLQPGVELMTAHMLALSAYAMRGSGAPGSVPGAAGGLVSSKSVSKVSVSYDVSVTAMEGAGPWNYTIYGQRFFWLMRMVGIGGYEVLGDYAPDTVSGTVLTWARGVMWRWGS